MIDDSVPKTYFEKAQILRCIGKDHVKAYQCFQTAHALFKGKLGSYQFTDKIKECAKAMNQLAADPQLVQKVESEGYFDRSFMTSQQYEAITSKFERYEPETVEQDVKVD